MCKFFCFFVYRLIISSFLNCILITLLMEHTSRYFKNPFSQNGIAKIQHELIKSRTVTCVDRILNNLPAIPNNCDGGLYVGIAGTAYSLYYLAKCGLFQAHTQQFLDHSHSYIKVALDYCTQKRSKKKHEVSFLLEAGGVYAVAALIYNAIGDKQKCQKYLDQYKALVEACVPVMFLETGSDELFVGRAGYLLGVLLLQRDLKVQVLNDEQIDCLCQSIIESGKRFRSRLRIDIACPLMYSYHGTLYLGAGHGIAGILQVLLSFPNFLARHPSSAEAVRKSVDYLLSSCMSDGNIPPDLGDVIYSGQVKMLVHWCHGAAGVIYTFARAYLVFDRDEKYLSACRRLAETVWEKGLLRKGPGICHGVAGSGYVFLLMYRLTGEQNYLYQAERFGSFIFTDTFVQGARTPDSPFSLFEGLAGTVCFLNDLMQPDKAEFPLSDVMF